MSPPATSKFMPALWLGILVVPAWGQVTTTSHTGPGSLPAVISAAAPGSTITFDPSLDGQRIVLNPLNGALKISKNLVIDASGLPLGLTISTAPSTSSTVIELSAGATLDLNSITISRGLYGIINRGTLSLRHCTVIENSGPGLFNYNGGTLSVKDSTVSYNGIGIENYGNLLVHRSLISRHSGLMAAIGNAPGATASIEDSTLWGNTTGITNAGSLQLRHATVAGNTGGIENIGGVLTVENSIVANNRNPEIRGGYVAAGVNIVRSEYPGHTGTGRVLTIDPLLGPIGNFGGPTKSMRPQPRSPAIDAAMSPVVGNARDQRGLARISGSGPDIGAVELADILVNTSADEDDGIATGGISLRDALAAVAPGKVELIRFDPAVFPATIQLAGKGLEIPYGEVTVDARDINGEVEISGNGSAPVLKIGTSANVGLRMLAISGGGGQQGGGISLAGGATGFVDRCSIHSNSSYIGGGIASSGTLHLVNSTIANNSAEYAGAGIYYSGAVYLLHCTLAGNTAGSSGGGIHRSSGSSEYRNTIVANNLPTDFGGGAATFKGKNLISNIDGSSASESNAALIIRSPLLAPLGQYGSFSRTMPPLPGSPAIDRAATAADLPSTDQNGRPRTSGALPDIGAVEALALGALGLASADGDTIPDILEGPGTVYAHLDPEADDSSLDSDGDGMRDADEISGMTDPQDPTDFFRVVSLRPVSGFHAETNPLFEATIKTFPGLSYHLAMGSGLQDLEPVTDSGFVADDFAQTLEVLLPAGKGFLQVRSGGVPNE
jgi:hypothetical protein